MNVYHPSLWANRSYPCCGSSQRSTSKATNGCRPVTWSPNTLQQQHMGINFSQIIHHPSPSPSPVAKTANGAEVEAAVVTMLPVTIGGDVVPASPSISNHNAIAIASATGRVPLITAQFFLFQNPTLIRDTKRWSFLNLVPCVISSISRDK